MTKITDEYMQEMLTKTRDYAMVLLKAGPNIAQENVRQIIWEHGRRNFELRAEGKLAIVGPVTANADILGLYVFNADPKTAAEIMDGDPAVLAGVFLYQAYPIKSFPGDALGF